MASFIWAVICQQIITDRETNAVSYINALEAIALGRFPTQLPPLYVATLWQKTAENDKVEMRIKVYAPDGSTVHTEDGPIAKFGKEFRRYRVNMLVVGASAPKPGVYQYAVEQKQGGAWREVAKYPLEVLQVDLASIKVPA